MIDEVKVKRTVGVPFASAAPEPRLDLQKPADRRAGIHPRLDNCDSIAILISGRIGPGGGSPPARPAQDRQSCPWKERESGFKQVHRRGVAASQIGSQRNNCPSGQERADARLRKLLTQ
jgi:hypothetical protein